MENWHYLEEQDENICPVNRPIPFKNDSRKIKVALFKISKSMNVRIVGTVQSVVNVRVRKVNKSEKFK
ncbi:hypothetical protein BH735_00550 [Enterococcus hirae]|nr:hypothetical protein BH735_00550 [Enterococcus hirae]